MYYRHNLNYQYPEKSDEHMITVKHIRDIAFDEIYPYYRKGIWQKIKRGALWVVLHLVGFPACTIRYGLKIHGRKKFKKYKKQFKNGDIGADEYRAFQREIIEAESKLKKFKTDLGIE